MLHGYGEGLVNLSSSQFTSGLVFWGEQIRGPEQTVSSGDLLNDIPEILKDTRAVEVAIFRGRTKPLAWQEFSSEAGLTQ